VKNSRPPLSLSRPQPKPATVKDLQALESWTEVPLNAAQEAAVGAGEGGAAVVEAVEQPPAPVPVEPPAPAQAPAARAKKPTEADFVLPWDGATGEKAYHIVLPARLYMQLKHLGVLQVDDSMRQFSIRALQKAADEEVKRRIADGTLPYPRRPAG